MDTQATIPPPLNKLKAEHVIYILGYGSFGGKSNMSNDTRQHFFEPNIDVSMNLYAPSMTVCYVEVHVVEFDAKIWYLVHLKDTAVGEVAYELGVPNVLSFVVIMQNT